MCAFYVDTDGSLNCPLRFMLQAKLHVDCQNRGGPNCERLLKPAHSSEVPRTDRSQMKRLRRMETLEDMIYVIIQYNVEIQ